MEKEIDTQTEMATVFEHTRMPYESALQDDAPSLKNFYSCRPDDTLFMPITAGKDTVFHIAAYRGSEELLRVLLEMVPPSRKRDVLKLKNIHGNTILHEVAVSGKVKAADFLVRTLLLPHGSSTVHEKDIREREEILADRNNLGETPLYRAAAFGSAKMVMYLAKEIEEVGTLHDHFKRNDGISILHIAVIYQNFDSAIWLLNKDPNLASYKMEKDGKTCLHLLASMPTAFRSTSRKNIFTEFLYDRWKTIEKLWTKKKMNTSAVKLMGMLVRRDASWLVPHEAEEDNLICLDREEEDMEAAPSAKRRSRLPDTPLLTAARTGIQEIVKEILEVYPQAVEHVNQNGQNILHLAILHRHSHIFDLVNQKKEASHRLVLGIDNYGCTILHYTAVMEYYTGGTSTTVALKLQEELKWFKDVQHRIPLYYTMHRNKENLTAKESFNKKHGDQHKAAQEWVKNTSQSCSTVAVLVATVVFAAAYTAPGGYLTNGKPLLLERPLYSFFTVMDVAGLASSLTSVVVFLSVLTSSLEIDDFLRTLPRKLMLGFIFLFFSVTATMLSFTATILLLIHLEKKWTATLTYAAAFLPICVFAMFQFPLYYEYTVAAIRSIVDFIQAILPGNWDLDRFRPN
ncbi:protein of unknown function DUF3447 - like 10 [Theobroma cacao]|nr:protein of unknown function DUF3447 - like 10 [Theobroma cacao]